MQCLNGQIRFHSSIQRFYFQTLGVFDVSYSLIYILHRVTSTHLETIMELQVPPLLSAKQNTKKLGGRGGGSYTVSSIP